MLFSKARQIQIHTIPYHTKEDDDALAPQQVQRRYKRREKREISALTEMEELKQQLKEAIIDARNAAKDAHVVKQELEKLTDIKEFMEESKKGDLNYLIDLLEKNRKKKLKEDGESGEPWESID